MSIVVVLGGRQAGKSSLVLHLARKWCALRPAVVRGESSFALATAVERTILSAPGVAAVFLEAAPSVCPLVLLAELGRLHRKYPGSFRVDSMVAVVDAGAFLEDVEAGQEIPHETREGSAGTNVASEVLIEQIELADVVVVNKTDLASEAGGSWLLDVVEAISLHALVVPATFGRAAAGLFAGPRVRDRRPIRSPAWLGRHSGERTLSVLRYRSPRGVEADRVMGWLADPPVGVIRARGELAIVGIPDHRFEISIAGPARALRRSDASSVRRDLLGEPAPVREGADLTFVGVAVDDWPLASRL